MIETLHSASVANHTTNATCYGSGDLYYVSKEGFSEFGAITDSAWRWNPLAEMQKESNHTNFTWYSSNEIAIPVTMQALIKSGLRDVPICWKTKGLGLDELQYGKDSTDPQCCWGSYKLTAGPAVIANSTCGHKMDMTDPCAKLALVDAWTGETS